MQHGTAIFTYMNDLNLYGLMIGKYSCPTEHMGYISTYLLNSLSDVGENKLESIIPIIHWAIQTGVGQPMWM